MQLMAGRVSPEYNRRKSRKGAFWEDRYHATAVAADLHLARCLTYVDLNMVRAGIVSDPGEWRESGYAELMQSRQRYHFLDYEALQGLLGFDDRAAIRSARRKWVEESLRQDPPQRVACWSESLAVGNEDFVRRVKQGLRRQARNRVMTEEERGWVLREAEADYGILTPKWPF